MQVAPGMAERRLASRIEAMRYAKVEKRMQDRQRMYEAATGGRRGSSFNLARGANPNKEINIYSKTVRERSRYLYKNTPTTKKAVRTIVNNVVGLGIIPTPVTKDAEVYEKLRILWSQFADHTSCDWNGKCNFYGLQKLATKTVAISGESYAIRKDVKTNVNALGLQIMLVEPEFLDDAKSIELNNGAFIEKGLEYNSEGKIVAYWFFPVHPDIRATESIRVDAKNVAPMHEIDRPGQDRGMPMGAAVTLTERDLDDYKDSTIVGAKASASFAGFVTNSNPEKTDDYNEDDYDDVGNMKLEPGTMYKLSPGESITFPTPPTNSNFDPFTRVYQRDLAAGWGITYEQMTGDYSNVNFSSGRMGWIEAQKMFDDWQWNMVIPHFCKPIYDWFLQKAFILLSKKERPEDLTITWTTPRREMLDPVKEVTAIVARIQAGLLSWEEAVRMESYIPEELFNEIKNNFEKFNKEGIPASWMQPAQGKNDSKKEE